MTPLQFFSMFLQVIPQGQTPMRAHQLDAAAKRGEVKAVVDILAQWPQGEEEGYAWKGAKMFSQSIADAHEKHSGVKIPLEFLSRSTPRVVLAGTGALENYEADARGGFFVRTGTFVMKRDELKEIVGSLLIVAGAVRVADLHATVVLSAGSIEVLGKVTHVVVVSCGDIILQEDARKSLFIAGGKVVRRGALGASTVIERESKPLGFLLLGK